MKRKISKNERAGEIMGFRPEGIPIDQPCELGFHCPKCKYRLTYKGDYDERLDWSEYNGFLWCSVCNKDYPSAFCKPNMDKAIECFLDTEQTIKFKTKPKLKQLSKEEGK